MSILGGIGGQLLEPVLWVVGILGALFTVHWRGKVAGKKAAKEQAEAAKAEAVAEQEEIARDVQSFDDDELRDASDEWLRPKN